MLVKNGTWEIFDTFQMISIKQTKGGNHVWLAGFYNSSMTRVFSFPDTSE